MKTKVAGDCSTTCVTTTDYVSKSACLTFSKKLWAGLISQVTSFLLLTDAVSSHDWIGSSRLIYSHTIVPFGIGVSN